VGCGSATFFSKKALMDTVNPAWHGMKDQIMTEQRAETRHP
jgi:hypothetical protein